MRGRLLIGSLLIVGGALTSVATPPTADARVQVSWAAAPTDLDGFVMSGDLDGLYPGASVQLQLLVTNPNDVDIEVGTIETTVTGVSGCGDELLEVGGLTDPVVVEGLQSTTVALLVRLAPNAPDACQGAPFALAFTGSTVTAVAGALTGDPDPPAGSPPDITPARPAGELPRTGASIAILTLLGWALLAVGFHANRLGRKRPQQP